MSQPLGQAAGVLRGQNPPMHNTSARRFLLTLLAALALLTSACGGGGDDAEATSDSASSDSSSSDSAATDDGDDMADESTSEPVRPTRDELCEILGGNVDQLAAYAQLNDVEETDGRVIGSDCAIKSSSVGYVSLSLVPAFEPDLQTAAEGFDGSVVPSGATDSILLIEDPAGISHIALIEEGGVIYQLQVSSDQATTQLAGAEEAAISLQVSIRNR